MDGIVDRIRTAPVPIRTPSNVYDSLAEAVRAAGDRERSIELNPGNTNAVQKLAEMGAR